MAEEQDLERTEPASQRRLEQAREEGQVPQSRELSTFLILLAGAGGIWVMGAWLAARTASILREGLVLDRATAFETSHMAGRLLALASDALLAVAPLLGTLLLAALAAPLLMGGWVLAPKAVTPDFTRLDPIKGFGRIFSVHGLAELVKGVLKSLLVGGVALAVVWYERDAVFQLLALPLDASLHGFGHLVALSTLLIVAAFVIIAAIDVPFQLWQYHSRLRMTKEEVRQEAKEMEGDPQLKARIGSQQREIARRRMMAEVPKADVVVTNPTHFSVALRYDAARMGAPRVVAKGRGEIAARIREVAQEHRVPLVEAPPLARALYRHAALGKEIPAALYTAVAEIMAYVYQLGRFREQGGVEPQPPTDLALPPGIDPGPEED
jgi:flagellar biosynthetic protein FlhB